MKKQCLICRVPDCGLPESEKVDHCPINKFLSVLGGKWTMIILLVLEKPHRFGELKRTIPDITEKMLITTLRVLEEHNLITKEITNGKQLSTTYAISEKGTHALTIAESMAAFGKTV